MSYSPVHITPAGRVAAVVRAELARQRVSGAELARRINRSQSSIARRLAGDIPFDINELTLIAEQLGMTVAELTANEAAGARGEEVPA